MVIVKVLKSKFGNKAFRLFVDNKEILTLREGTFSKINLEPGKHTVYFKLAEWLGAKSNKINIVINSSVDLVTIECKPSIFNGGKITAGASVEKGKLQYFEVRCNSCGWKGIRQSENDLICEYCGSILSVKVGPNEQC